MNIRQMSRQVWDAARRLNQQFPYLYRAFRMIYHAAGALTVTWLILLVIQGLLPVATVYLTRTLVDGIAVVLGRGGGWQALLPILPAAGAMAFVLIGGEIVAGAGKWIRTAQSERVQDHVQEIIHEQSLNLDLSFYDDPGFYDQLHRARIDALSRPAALMENTGSLAQSLITLVAMGGVLAAFGFWVPLLLAVSTLPALLVVLRHTIRFHQWRMQNTIAIRKTNYCDVMLTQREPAAEMRLFSLGAHFQKIFRNLRKRLRSERVQLARSEAIAESGASILGLASMGLALLWLAAQASKGRIGLGDLALFYQAFYQGQRMMRSLLGSAGDIYRNIMFLENLFEFLALKPRIGSPENPLPHPGLQRQIELQEIVFRYPGSDRFALSGFNLRIPAGQITALVGENGAGKTTLIKLLCRFYDPEKGCILIDGRDIRALSMNELRRRITVLFQEPVRYHDTVYNNIAFGDMDSIPDRERIEAAARAAGADASILRLPGTYEAVLGKWFGGAELSGGEWQRLALARAFLRQAELVILDEPTSSMDSWAEADWLLRFRKLVAGRTALIITHRFTTALHADVIHVMEEGRIVESGSHKELLAIRGRYASSWRRQMQQEGV